MHGIRTRVFFFHKTEEFKVKRFSFYCSILKSPHEKPMKPKVIIINIFICILSEFSNRKNITMYIFISIQTALKVAFFPLINLGLQHIQIYYQIRIVYYFLLFHNLYNQLIIERYLTNYQFLLFVCVWWGAGGIKTKLQKPSLYITINNMKVQPYINTIIFLAQSCSQRIDGLKGMTILYLTVFTSLHSHQ